MIADIAKSMLRQRIERLQERRCPKSYCVREFPEERDKSY